MRKLDHSSLITKGTDGVPNDKGMKLLLQTLKDNIAQEAPVKTNELFFTAFYSPGIWRGQNESMQQYIVRREQDFKRLEEVLSGGKVPEHLRAMMLLTFGGLDRREQLSVLSSTGNEYNLDKISKALRIQYPTCSGKPVFRKDYLGCGRAAGSQGPAPSAKFRPRPPKGKGKSRSYVLAVADGENDDVDEDEEELEGDEAYEVDECPEDTLIDSLLADGDLAEDQEFTEALATVMQKKKDHSSRPVPGQSFNFKAKGEMSSDKAKESRKSAVRFLKTITPCTSCGQRGHWQGDPECPNKKPSKGSGPKKRAMPKKKGSPSSFFVQSDLASVDGFADVDAAGATVLFAASDDLPNINSPTFSFGMFNNGFELASADSESFMVLRDTDLCGHSSYNGGDERKFFRSANGHMRGVHCKDDVCGRAVISAQRKEPVQLWKYFVLVALTTKWGSKSRSWEVCQSVSRARDQARAEKEKEAEVELQRQHDLRGGYPSPLPVPFLRPPSAAASSSMAQDDWSVLNVELDQHMKPPKAKIVRPESIKQRAWVYGVCIASDTCLPAFPELDQEDQDILQPLPSDNDMLGADTPFCGRTFADVASSADGTIFCSSILNYALANNPMQPTAYRFSFYLYGRLKLVKGAVDRMSGSSADGQKRVRRPGDMVTSRQIRVPVSMDPNRLDIVTEQDCDVMMATSSLEKDARTRRSPTKSFPRPT